jgi:hypothetical protein
MSIARVQAFSNGFAAAVTARTFAFPANVTAGNLIVAGIITFNSSITVTVTDSLGNTYTQAGSYAVSTTTRASIWYSANILGGANTVTITPSASAFVTAGVVEYSGATTTPIDGTTTNTGTSTTLSTGSIAVAQAGDLVFGAIAISNSSQAKFDVSATGNLVCVDISGSIEPAALLDTIAGSATNLSLLVNVSTVFAAAGASFKAVSGGGASGGMIVHPGMGGGMRG